MKARIAYYLMLLYVTVMFKPVIPVVADGLSHTFSEAIHIATVHAIYGNNHLQKEVSNTASDSAGKKHLNSNAEEQCALHVPANQCVYDYCISASGKDFFSLISYRVHRGFIAKNFTPPRFAW